MTPSAWLVGVLAVVLGSTPSQDPIDAALAEVHASPMFGNGIHQVFPLPKDAKSSDIIAAAYPTWRFEGKQPKYVILEERDVKIYMPARAVLVRTGKTNIVCFLEYSTSGWTIDQVFE